MEMVLNEFGLLIEVNNRYYEEEARNLCVSSKSKLPKPCAFLLSSNSKLNSLLARFENICFKNFVLPCTPRKGKYEMSTLEDKQTPANF